MKRNFVNVQMMVRSELAQKFQEVYEQSESNSKGEFLNSMLRHWLNPELDQANLKKIEDLEAQLEQLKKEHSLQVEELEEIIESQSQSQDALFERKETLEMSNDEILMELQHYRKHLSPILERYRGQVVRPRHPITKRRIRRVIKSEKDVMDVIMNSIKIS